MDAPLPGKQAAELLLEYLNTSNELEAQSLLTRLITDHAAPIIKSIIRYKLRASNAEAEDVYGNAVLRLLTRLRAFKSDADSKVIHDFRSYVAVATYHACHDHLRGKYPRRRRLKDGLRQTLIRDPRFAIWEEAGRSQLCGLTAWRKLAPVERRRLRVQPDEIKRAVLLNEDPGRMKQGELIATILEHIGEPIELEELTEMVANLCGIREYELEAAADGDFAERLVAPQIRADDEIALREYVARLWEEILQLPQRQRVALLLSLKDAQGRSALSLFPLINVATLGRLAEAIELTPEQFGEIWNELPLNDAAIAARLGLTRQQVINLRKSARERLARRMKMFDEGG